ncbi:hypothetical protein PTTG_27871 [Puccinia triticina 1-1 BBBD Race 1]|uniref:Uncharacterized protein n=1 Tax=Puccinia triticina (isolate 1-1 / race 1 (BBBD)) TaxID=630390 RepID=A0A180GHE8_PUCT1|nr:hypothetical protein PTTG_27871 [Puccinia triticina 1-1 BBBD Race 1]
MADSRLVPQPAQLTPQVIDCNTSFKFFYKKFSTTNKSMWAMIKSKKPKLFPIKFLASSTLEDFKEVVASKCNDQFDSAGDLIQNAIIKGSPRIEWKVSMNIADGDELIKKSADYQITDESSFNHWTASVILTGQDRMKASMKLLMINPETTKKQAKAVIDPHRWNATNPSNPSAITVDGNFDAINLYTNQIFPANPPNVKYETRMPVHINPTNPTRYIPLTVVMVQQWAYAIVQGKQGVDVCTPPAGFKFKNFSAAKKRKLHKSHTHQSPSPNSDSDSSSIIDLEVNLLNEYLTFVKIPLVNRDGIVAILTQNKATNPKVFQSKGIPQESMIQWGVPEVYVAQLRKNVSKFVQSNAS